MASSSSSSSISLPHGFKYHVFISFRGIDTRMNFAGHLYDALSRNGIKVFFDDEELQKGEEISPALEKAIRESWIALVIFSINYASSTWCLEELAKVMEYKNKLVLPVFYKVNPSDLRYQKGTYAEAFAKHEERFERWKIERWKLALHNAAQVSGWTMSDQRYEYKVIGEIVDNVSKKIRTLGGGDDSVDQRNTIWRDEKIESVALLLPGTEDRIVLYWTSLRGVRKTYEDCSKVKMILNNLRVSVDERDINLNSLYRQELKNALGKSNVSLPQVFIRGKYIGNADIIEKLNESGELEKLLKGLPIQSTKNDFCSKCGNARFVSCSMCSGSSWRIINMCKYCNEKGFIRCSSCCS